MLFLKRSRLDEAKGKTRPGCNGAFVCQVPRDAALILLLCSSNEGRVVDETILGRIALSLQRPAYSRQQVSIHSRNLN